MTKDLLYTHEPTRLLDVSQIDFYVLGTAEHFTVPGRWSAGDRNWQPARPLWEDKPDPVQLVAACAEAVDLDREVWIVENGMCNRVKGERSYPRADGWTRDRYLRANLGAVVEAIEGGIPVTGYWHWTLADNYEWGSYEPRFGLYGIEHDNGLSVSARDAMGVDSATTYRELIAGLRAGDRSVLDG